MREVFFKTLRPTLRKDPSLVFGMNMPGNWERIRGEG
jgi:hypothetical protein